MRLTKDAKHKIEENFVKSAALKRQEMERELGSRLYLMLVSNLPTRIRESFKDKYEVQYLHTATEFIIPGFVSALNGSKWCRGDTVTLPHPAPHTDYYSPPSEECLKSPAQKKIVQEAVAELQAMDDKIKTARQAIKSNLYSINTVKQLIDMWPDAEEYLPAEVAKPKQLPTAKIDTTLLNTLKNQLN